MFESEERQIADKIKDFIKSKNPPWYLHIMLRDGHTLHTRDYRYMVSHDKINPHDAYVYFDVGNDSSKSAFYYPFLRRDTILFYAYLSKLGFYYGDFIVPATGLKYAAITNFYKKYFTLELVNLDTVVSNTNLRKITFEVLGGKLVSEKKELEGDEYRKILEMFSSQRLFAGHNFEETWYIIREYYDRRNKSLIKEVVRIAMDYDRIFQPYKVCYETKNWNETDRWKIKLE